MPHNADKIFKVKAEQVKSYANNRLPGEMRDLGLQFFKSRFRAQGWLDTSFKPWPRRKKEDKKRAGRAILIYLGRLRNSIRASIQGANIVFGSDGPYAKIHNEGGTIKRHARSELIVRNRHSRGAKGRMFGGMGAFKKGTTRGKGLTFKAHSIKMPQRQFMGKSAHLDKIITRKITNQLNKIFKP